VCRPPLPHPLPSRAHVCMYASAKSHRFPDFTSVPVRFRWVVTWRSPHAVSIPSRTRPSSRKSFDDPMVWASVCVCVRALGLCDHNDCPPSLSPLLAHLTPIYPFSVPLRTFTPSRTVRVQVLSNSSTAHRSSRVWCARKVSWSGR
jgi:hypothetical protein